MSGIVLSAAVRQNLLSLQDTASLLSTTQNRLATGNKVNSALDNPTNFFTAQSLNNRASDINNLLDSIGNGDQVLQAPTGYTTKSSATSLAPTGAGVLAVAGTAADLTNAGTNSLNGKTFVFTPGTGAATTITISSTVAAGNVNSIDAFNTALTSAGLGLSASLASDGSITLTSTNDNASQTLPTGTTAVANNIAISGTDTETLVTPTGGTAGAPVADPASQAIRASLVSQYNNIITQISTTAQDSSFNGINLLFGDNLKLTFDETGKSTLGITGVTFDAAGLGLGSLTTGKDFLDNSSANAALTKLSATSTTLRTEASALGSNLSVVQLRQDFKDR